ncbi:MAG: phosphatidate cytidylyltransferase [Pseudomonadota bacterium]|nr:phosphatidate cytidylyltransferase [Pseudomonadota bacterium]
MLKQRVITALVLLALLLPALFSASTWPFAVLTLIAFGAAGCEWSRLNGASGLAIPLGVALAAACAAAWFAGWTRSAPALAWWIATAIWLGGGAWMLRSGAAAWPALPKGLRWFVGLALLFTAWLALVNAKAIGVNFILSVLTLVWAADIAAYFGGRAFGRRKLAPSISPGKSWEGVWSGMAGALVLAALWLAFEHAVVLDSKSLFATLSERFGLAGLAVAVVFLVAMSVVGDLFESLVKRSAGAKDSSGLLPGHGGVLDRIDALLPVLPIALALAST